jgi:hypothetical protein
MKRSGPQRVDGLVHNERLIERPAKSDAAEAHLKEELL